MRRSRKVIAAVLVAGALGISGGTASARVSEDSKDWRWWKMGNRMAECGYVHDSGQVPPRSRFVLKQVWDNEGQCFYLSLPIVPVHKKGGSK